MRFQVDFADATSASEWMETICQRNVRVNSVWPAKIGPFSFRRTAISLGYIVAFLQDHFCRHWDVVQHAQLETAHRRGGGSIGLTIHLPLLDEPLNPHALVPVPLHYFFPRTVPSRTRQAALYDYATRAAP